MIIVFLLIRFVKYNFADENAISIYPNPSNGHFSIEGKELMDSNITVIDILGNIIIQKVADNNLMEFNAINLSSGVYLIKIDKEKKL